MRECPNCGYKDPPYWRNVRHRLFTSYCHITELEFDDKELAMVLKQKKDCKIGNYIYHYMPKSGIVQRIHIDDSRDGKTIRENLSKRNITKEIGFLLAKKDFSPHRIRFRQQKEFERIFLK